MWDIPGSRSRCGWYDGTVWLRTATMAFSHQARTFTSPALIRRAQPWHMRARGRVFVRSPKVPWSKPRRRVLRPRSGRRGLGLSAGHQTLTETLKKTRELSSGRRQITSSDSSRLHHHVSKSSYDTGYYMPEERALPLALGLKPNLSIPTLPYTP